jgi:hypothetical protein
MWVTAIARQCIHCPVHLALLSLSEVVSVLFER